MVTKSTKFMFMFMFMLYSRYKYRVPDQINCSTSMYSLTTQNVRLFLKMSTVVTQNPTFMSNYMKC